MLIIYQWWKILGKESEPDRAIAGISIIAEELPNPHAQRFRFGVWNVIADLEKRAGLQSYEFEDKKSQL